MSGLADSNPSKRPDERTLIGYVVVLDSDIAIGTPLFEPDDRESAEQIAARVGGDVCEVHR